MSGPPEGTPPTRDFHGPWLETQLTLSAAIGLSSFLIFSWCRTRWPVIFAPRTKLKGFSPHEAHSHSSFFAWILPTIRTSEFTILQIVGLDAAVLLSFFKMSFYLFSLCSVLAVCILMPVNYYNNISIIDDGDEDGDDKTGFSPRRLIPFSFAEPPTRPHDPSDWYNLFNDANSIETLHLLLTYAFTLIALHFIYKNYQRFIRTRQLFCLELVHSIPARTIMVTDVPPHLRGEEALAVHFENMDLPVESVNLCRELGSLQELIERRTEILLQLESAWTEYVGNPSSVQEYDPSLNIRSDPSVGRLIDSGDGGESQDTRLVVPNRPRPTIRPKWFGKKVDALDYLGQQFLEADEALRRKRRSAKFKATSTAFVTFETMSSAQIAAQVATSHIRTSLAPEPRDIVWHNVALSRWQAFWRENLVNVFLGVFFLFWAVPVTFLATLLNYKEIEKLAPWLAKIIDMNGTIQSLVQNTLPSIAVISLNGLLPFLLEALSYLEGVKSRSGVEYSLLKKYFLFLLINVVFIFLLTDTYWALVRDLANSPAKIPEKMAQSLRTGKAKAFFLSYVILQGIGIMPLQLLNLGVTIPRVIYRILWTRTPRDYAELNAPPMINYGAVYPQAILIFVITLAYSVIQPLILPFGALYFGMAYVVYKYKLLFVFYKPYESRGEAWPITCNRLMWGVVIFEVFMIGIFTLTKSFILSSLMTPLLALTIYIAWYMHREFAPLAEFVNLDYVHEVQRGGSEEIIRLRGGEDVSTGSITHLNRRRYAQNDETLYVAPEEDRTDYSQPPMANFYYGILNTGKRRYGHPALNGVLPQPWLPLKKNQTLANYVDHGDDTPPGKKRNGADAVVLTLRRKYRGIQKDVKRMFGRKNSAITEGPSNKLGNGEENGEDEEGDEEDGIRPVTKVPSNASGLANPWTDASPGPSQPVPSSSYTTNGTRQGYPHRAMSFDAATGVIMLPDDENWLGDPTDDSDSDERDASGTPTPVATPAADGSGESQLRRPGGNGADGADTRSITRRTSTYWHHPERRRTTSTTGIPSSSGTTRS